METGSEIVGYWMEKRYKNKHGGSQHIRLPPLCLDELLPIGFYFVVRHLRGQRTRNRKGEFKSTKPKMKAQPNIHDIQNIHNFTYSSAPTQPNQMNTTNFVLYLLDMGVAWAISQGWIWDMQTLCICERYAIGISTPIPSPCLEFVGFIGFGFIRFVYL